ncbi:MAG: NAD(P)H-dependent oxidoreductase [Sphaerochaetaceae bacterium]|jgi:FMN-dependent NADH-azoreductase
MDSLLYIDSCTRPAPASRTATLGEAFLDAYSKTHPGTQIDRTILRDMDLRPYRLKEVDERIAHIKRKEFDIPMFALARRFAAADTIVIAAPFWDCSFPSMLKLYFEHVCAQDITFGYTAEGQIGLCKATDLVYITTRGDEYRPSGEPDEMEMASPTIRAMAKMFGIPTCTFIAAGGLDIAGNDPQAILEQAITEARACAERLLS